ncbi:hypothetical protein C8Q70DRAFT_435381 [Cubamyces menziesii]|nr:hypothetical protein C8Q70DRAFT_435381 [Cubamyces menziesii]
MFFLYTTADDPAAAFIEGRVRIPHVGAPAVLSVAKAYVEGCLRSHEHCRAITHHRVGSPPLPRRLLDCSDPLRVRIVDTSRLSVPRQPYIALSYVWGPSKFQECWWGSSRSTGRRASTSRCHVPSRSIGRTGFT